jgi:prevent-host-death family protein
MAETVGAFEAKTHLSALLQRVERGEEITITRHGKAVARLVPACDREADAEARRLWVIEQSKRLRKKYSLGGIPARELINEGRKY